jgi:hypothetical protein
VYTLTNSGGTALGWVVSTPAPWLSLSPTAGTLPPFSITQVKAQFNAAATLLPLGSNHTQVVFSNPGSTTDPIVRDIALRTYPLPAWSSHVQATSTDFQARMAGVPTWNYRIEASTNLQDWSRVATNQADAVGILLWIDTQAPLFPRRFYRAVTSP